VWIVIRLILAVIGFAIRRLRHAKVPVASSTIEGVPYFETIHRNKQSITGFTIGMARTSPTWIRLHAESRVDRFCKWLGITNELQTGDARFDDTIYVTCDHPHVHAVFRESKPLRDAILAAFAAGYRWIRYDGVTVRMQRRIRSEPSQEDNKLLTDVWRASSALAGDPPSRLTDPFLWKALVIEGVIWGILGYALGAVIESRVHHEDYHLWHSQVIKTGLVVAAVGFLVLVGVIALWMRGSSRGHRVIVESAIVLLLGLPITAIQLVGDTNRALDNEPGVRAERRLERCEQRRHRAKRSYFYTYHLWLVQTPELAGPRLPRAIEVPSELCGMPTTPVHLTIGPGRWGIPWYREIRVGERTWRSPL
jgi:hypothetical protein